LQFPGDLQADDESLLASFLSQEKSHVGYFIGS